MVSNMCKSDSRRKQKLTKLIGVPTVYFLAEGIVFPSVGFFLVDFIDGLDTNARSMGFVHSLYLGILILLGPVATLIAKRFGNRATILAGSSMVVGGLVVTSQVTHIWQILLSHSLVTGCGLCLLTQGMVYDLASTFNKSASIYIGFMYAGSSVGFVVNPLIFSQSRLYFGWRGTILIGSAVSMHMLPLVLILFRTRRPTESDDMVTREVCCKENDEHSTEMTSKQLTNRKICVGESSYEDNDGANNIVVEKGSRNIHQSVDEFAGELSELTAEEVKKVLNEPDGQRQLEACEPSQQENPPSLLMFCKTPSLLLFSTVYFFGRFAHIGFFVHFTASLILKGFSEQEAALVFTAYGIGGMLGKSCCGIPGRFGIISNYNFYMISMFIIGFCFVTFSSITNMATLLTNGFVVGGFIGVFVGLFPAITQSCVSKEWFNFAYGYIGIPTGVSSALGGYIMGAVYDTSGVYTVSFYIAGICFFFNGFLMFTKICIDKCSSLRRSNSNIVCD
ncbi:monocarboxylate transporter 9-like [Antedon mediterranea]|uniref:monocarboxylate transporter 9-like n=1 Tax=Antedon mediterranea TaxID=105859 RepID=UPI003AF45C73